MSGIFPNEEKRELLLNLLTAMGCHKVVVTFSGGGDSGSVEGADVYDKDGNIIDIEGRECEWETSASYLSKETGSWERKSEVKMMSLHDVLKNVTESALEDTQLDWYNNEGGQGQLEIYPLETPVRIELNVGINITTTEDHYFNFSDVEDEEGEPTQYADLDAVEKVRDKLLEQMEIRIKETK